jgi:hypothetical protein
MSASLLQILISLIVLVTAGASLVLSQTRRRRAYYFSGRGTLVREAIREELDLGRCTPRFVALALSGLGEFSAARRALLVPPSASPEEDQELSLCVHIVAEAFEGNREESLSLCQRLLRAPLRSSKRDGVRRQARRAGVVAIARTVAGAGDEIDFAELLRTPTFEPALFWACRYSAALCCVTRNDAELAHSLVEWAPDWPEDSIFHRLQTRILVHVGHERAQRSAA